MMKTRATTAGYHLVIQRYFDVICLCYGGNAYVQSLSYVCFIVLSIELVLVSFQFSNYISQQFHLILYVAVCNKACKIWSLLLCVDLPFICPVILS